MAARPDYIPTTHTAAMLALKGKASRKIGNNTRLVQGFNQSVLVYYHATAIIKLHFDGTWEVTDGGYDTVTTRARLSVFLWSRGFRIGRHKGETRLTVVGPGYGDLHTIDWDGQFDSTRAAIASEHAHKDLLK